MQLQGVKPGPQMKASAGISVSSIPTDRELYFSCLLRGTRCGQKLRVNIFFYNSQSELIDESTTPVMVDHRQWTSISTMSVAPKDTCQLRIWIISYAGQPVFVTEPSLQVGNRPTSVVCHNKDYSYPEEPGATKVIEALYKAAARPLKSGETGTVTFPIPGPYRNQVPLNFTLEAKPKSALIDYVIKKREDGLNWIAEAKIRPPDKGVILTWSSLVLVRGHEVEILPPNSMNVPAHAEPWLRSSKCVQSDDEEIKAKAAELVMESTSLESYVRKVIHFTRSNRGKGKKFDSLDAKTAMGAGGSCTSRANLAAALLRANGVPARTVSHLPSWIHSYFFEHWLVEYWHPGVGWVWAEPTMERMQPAHNGIVVLAVSSTDDEDKCDDPFHLRYMMRGGAYLSGCEVSKELVMARIMKRVTGPNIAIEQSEIRGTNLELDELFVAALSNFERICEQKRVKDQSQERTRNLRNSAYDGSASGLKNVLLSEL